MAEQTTRTPKQAQPEPSSGVRAAGPRHARLGVTAMQLNAANRTGIPDTLKSGVEALSGVSLDHVRAHRGESPIQAQPKPGGLMRSVPPASGSAPVQRYVTFDPHLKVPFDHGYSGHTGFHKGNIDGLAEALHRDAPDIPVRTFIEAFGPYLGEEPYINFRNDKDAIAWVRANLPSSSGQAATSVAESETGPRGSDFLDAIHATLGGEADPSLVPFYAKLLDNCIARLESGKIGVRYLTLKPDQKIVVLHRLIQAMVALGNSQKDPVEFFTKHQVILHGSYLFGAAKDQPGDIDLIISGPVDLGKSLGIGGKLDREPSDNFSIGSKAGLLDHIVGIPFTEGGDEVDLGSERPNDLLDYASSDIRSYLKAAKSEKDMGKRARKFINIAIAVDYILRRRRKTSGLEKIIRQANQAIVSGSLPRGIEGEVTSAATTLLEDVD